LPVRRDITTHINRPSGVCLSGEPRQANPEPRMGPILDAAFKLGHYGQKLTTEAQRDTEGSLAGVDHPSRYRA